MKKQRKNIVNVVLVAIAIAMGVAVIVLPKVDESVTSNDLIRMLGIAIVSLGIYSLNKEEGKDKKSE